MYHVGRLGSYITRGVYTVSGPFHPFGGAVDIIVVEQPDGSFKSSPWYVRFGKFQGVLKAREKEVTISVNGVDADFHMYLDQRGEAYFLRDVEGEEGEFSSSSSSSSDETGENSQRIRRPMKSKSCNYDGQIDAANGDLTPRTRSRRSRLFGLVFGRKSMKKDSLNDGEGIVRVNSLDRAEIAANLLDVKWSTNLSSLKPMEDNASNGYDGKGDENRLIEESGSCDVEMRNGSRSNFDNREILIEENNVENSSSVSKGTEEVRFCAETLRVTTELLSEDAVVRQAEEIELDTFHSPPICRQDEVKVNLQVPLTLSESVDPTHSLVESEPNNISSTSGFSNPTENELQPSRESVIDVEKLNSAPVSESSEEEQFPFSDFTDSKYREIEKVSDSLDDVDREDRSSFSPSNTNDNSYSSPDCFLRKNPLSDNLIDNSKIASNAISIHVNTGAEVGQLTGSLPNMWSKIEKFRREDDPGRLSRSLDSDFISMGWRTPSKEKDTNSTIDKENRFSAEQSSEGNHLSENIGSGVENPSAGDPSKTVNSGGSWGIWPFRRSRSRKIGQDVENVSESNIVLDNDKISVGPKVLRKMIRANTPTSEELASLNLKEGSNVVRFTFSTAMLGKQKVDARIFLWKWNTRIVISDVDGTITKSDVLGQFMPLVGVDWSQTGVAHLFSAIKENGYQLLFLSARAISQAYITRQFLVNLKQDGKALPDGPVVISPDGLFPSLFREVIRRAPHEFKIACLEDIKALFPSDCNPFYAGFGNRDTDEFSYLKVGIPKGKIFTINPRGEVFAHGRHDSKSYSSLHDLVHGMFPAMSSSEQEDFNSWNFWRLPPPEIDI